MRAIQLIQAGQPLVLCDIPVPEISPQDVMVRVRAAGICHSDVHYRAGKSRVHPLPMTLGHEVAGVIEKTGDMVAHFKPGDRVCIHYMTTCGHCIYCNMGSEQFCTSGQMIGKYRSGGYAEYIAVPARSVFLLPDEIPFEHGAVMMCSSSTAYHALRKARLSAGETVAVFGIGGLGISAVQLAFAMGAKAVYAVDLNPEKLAIAESYGAIPIHARKTNAVEEIRRLTGGRGVDVALELIGLPASMEGAFQSLAIMGRVAIAGISEKPFSIDTYQDLINREAEVIGVSDHLAQELVTLIEFARLGKLDFTHTITQTVPLDADAVNETLDQLASFRGGLRVVIQP